MHSIPYSGKFSKTPRRLVSSPAELCTRSRSDITEKLLALHKNPPSTACSSTQSDPLTYSSSQYSLPEPRCDIGGLLTPEKSINEICRAVGNLSTAEKDSLLYHHAQPPKVLPSTYSHGCNQKFNISWLEKYPWLQYSPKLDGVLCGPCVFLL